jgi:hypothetical protein
LKELRLWCFVTAAVLLAALGGCAAYLRLGTTVVGRATSPDGNREVLTVVRNGVAMTGFATTVSIIGAHDLVARQFVPFGAIHVFFGADDNGGAVRLGNRGQMDVKVDWVTNTQLVVTYPEKASVFRQESAFDSVAIRYLTSR